MYEHKCSLSSKAPICCLGWGLAFTDASRVRSGKQKLGGELSLDDILTSTNDAKSSRILSDLPTELAFLDIETSLPKLSVLPIREPE